MLRNLLMGAAGDPYAAYVISLIRANDTAGTLLPVDSVSNGVTWTNSLSATYQNVVTTPSLISGGSYRCTTHAGSSQPNPGIYSNISSQFPCNQSTTYECSYYITSTGKISVLAEYRKTSGIDWAIVFNRGFAYLGGLEFGIYNTGTGVWSWTPLDFFPSANTTFSIAVSSVYDTGTSGQTHYICVNGVLKATVANPHARTATGGVSLGSGWYDTDGASSLKLAQLFYWDEARFTKGIARYITGYTPTLPHPDP